MSHCGYVCARLVMEIRTSLLLRLCGPQASSSPPRPSSPYHCFCGTRVVVCWGDRFESKQTQGYTVVVSTLYLTDFTSQIFMMGSWPTGATGLTEAKWDSVAAGLEGVLASR